MSILPDVLQANLDVVFCGTAASAISAREGAYYANPTNAFWRALHAIGLTPRLLAPSEFRTATAYGLGLTDIAKYATGNDSDLSTGDFDAENLREKIMQCHPKILAFTSKKGASVFLVTPTGKLTYGKQSEPVGTTTLWVLPSPSGAARRYWDITVWQALADATRA